MLTSFLLYSTRTVRLEVTLHELNLKIRNLQDSHLSESRFIQRSQQETLERLLAQLHNLQEVQGRTHGALSILGDNFNRSQESISQTSRDQVDPLPSTGYNRLTDTTTLSSHDQTSGVVSLKVEQSASSTCRQTCSCQCHILGHWRSHRLLGRVLGHLFIGYSRTPNISLSCDLNSCGRYRRSIVSVFYVFPQWLVQYALFAVLLHTKRSGLVLSLKAVRPRLSSDMLWTYAQTGDIPRLRTLFDKGEASPFDIVAQNQYSLLDVRIIKFYVGSGTNILVACG